MSVLCVHVRRLCVPNIISIGVCFKKTESRQCWCVCLMQRQNLRLFSVSGLKEEKLIKTQTYTKTETRKLYSRVF